MEPPPCNLALLNLLLAAIKRTFTGSSDEDSEQEDDKRKNIRRKIKANQESYFRLSLFKINLGDILLLANEKQAL